MLLPYLRGVINQPACVLVLLCLAGGSAQREQVQTAVQTASGLYTALGDQSNSDIRLTGAT